MMRHFILLVTLLIAFAAVEVLGPVFQCVERGIAVAYPRLILYAFFNAGVVLAVLSVIYKYVFAGMLITTTVYGIFAYMNLLHYRALDSFFPFYMLTETQQLDGLSGSIIGVMHWYDLSFLLVLVALWYVLIRFRKWWAEYKLSHHLLILGIYILLIFCLVSVTNKRMGWEFGKWRSTVVSCCQFSPVDCYTKLGLMSVIAYQLDNIQASAKGLSQEEQRQADELICENISIYEETPAALDPKQNVVIMLLESFNSACISSQVMPVLDSLRRLSTSYYIPNVRQLTQGGMSIGGQLVVLSGLHGLLNAPFCSACPYNKYPSIARAQKEAHDSVYAYTVVSSDRYFWRQSEVSDALGFDDLFDRFDAEPGEINKHGWANDASMMKLAAEKIPQDATPFVSLIVTSDMHSPYVRDETIPFDITFSGVEDPVLSEYMRRASNLDEQIEKFIAKLKNKGVYDNTLIVVTSDHQVPETYCSAAMNDWKSAYIPALFINAGEQWSEINSNASDVVFCHSQLYPTMLKFIGGRPNGYSGLFPPMIDLERTIGYDFDHLEYTSTSNEKLKKIYELEERMIQCGYFGANIK